VRSAQWKRFVGPWLDDRWALAGTLAYVRPGDRHVLTGVMAERSSADGFYIWQVRLPLYGPPLPVVVLDWSERVGGGSCRHLQSDPATAGVVRAAMDRALVEGSLGQVVVEPPGGVGNGSTEEVRGYGLLLSGDFAGAVECLREVEGLEVALDIEWQRRLVERAGEMRVLVETGDIDAALARLASWRAETIATLRIQT